MENKFFKPKSLAEALEILSREKATIIAGGTDIMVEIHESREVPQGIVDISSLEELKFIDFKDGYISIGALCTHGEIENNSLIKEHVPMLSKACSLVGSTTIRNRGTIGGNVVNSSTCADSVPPLLIYDAEVVFRSFEGSRAIKIKDFFLNGSKVDIRPNEIVTEFKIKVPEDCLKWDIVKVGRRKSLSISRLTLAIALREENGVLKELRICPGAMLPRHGRLWETEKAFTDKELSQAVMTAIGDSAANEAILQAGRRWSTEYKEPVLKGLIMRCLEEITDCCKG